MGYADKILWVDLAKGVMESKELPKELKEEYLGGRGLGVKLVYDNGVDVDPLGPGNILVFAAGPLTGTSAPASGRFCVVSKSPATGTIFDSHSGGRWGPELKFAGFDAIVVKGKAQGPVYLWINGGGAEIRDASAVWGKDVFETTDLLVREVGDDMAKVACIGPAGEKLAKIASIMNDKYRAAGRGGLGAVMGSKNLKAIVVRGTKKPVIADQEAFDTAVAEARKMLKENAVTGQGLPTYGTAVLVNIINGVGAFPTRNFQTGVFENADDISGETIAKTILDKKRACWGCPIACGRGTSIKSGKYKGDSGEGPEYETTWSFGAHCGNDDLMANTRAHYLCNKYGLDAISAGHVIGTAMELYERGDISRDRTGMGLSFGDADAIVQMTEMMGKREGFGKDLGEGSKRLATKYGAPELSMDVKGLELPAYDPRAVQGHGLGYATSNRGGCHLRAYMIAPEVLGIPEKMDPLAIEGKPEMLKIFQDGFAVVDSLVLCKFVTFAIFTKHFADLMTGATGTEYTEESIMTIGERIYNLERMYNNKAGFDRKDDTLPKRLLEEAMPEGPAKGYTHKLGEMLDKYYGIRGWDKQGKPTEEKLEELGLA
ncbi:MAG: aldehyde ferredoxin oxidoreductase family protein [Methanocellales archaeon]|nr:aldehyde ferredoxin oxidoreductase family protein [Methanocellales archaeon]